MERPGLCPFSQGKSARTPPIGPWRPVLKWQTDQWWPGAAWKFHCG